MIAILTTNGQSGTDEDAFSHLNRLVIVNDPRPQGLFPSVSVPLTTRVSSKVKAKIWAYPSVGSSSQPPLTLEPYHTSKGISNMS